MRVVAAAAIAGVALFLGSTTARAQAPASPVQQSMRQLMLAEEAYYYDHGTYTTDLSALGLISKLDRKEPQVLAPRLPRRRCRLDRGCPGQHWDGRQLRRLCRRPLQLCLRAQHPGRCI